MNTTYLIITPDLSLGTKKVKEICNKQQIEEQNITVFDYIETGLSKVLEDINTYSLFGSKKATILLHPNFLIDKAEEDTIKDFSNYLEHPSTDNFLFIIAEKVDDRKKIVKELKKTAQVLAPTNTAISLNAMLEGYTIENDAMTLLKEKCLNDSNKMQMEIEKLKIYSNAAKVITKKAVEDLVTQKYNDTDTILFSFSENLLKQNKKEAITLYQELMAQSFDPMSILGLLGSQLHIMYQVKALTIDGYTPDNIASKLKAHPYRIKKTKELTLNYSLKELEELLVQLANLDLDIKSGKIDVNHAIDLFLLK